MFFFLKLVYVYVCIIYLDYYIKLICNICIYIVEIGVLY